METPPARELQPPAHEYWPPARQKGARVWILHTSIIRFVTNGLNNNSSVPKLLASGTYHEILIAEISVSCRAPARKLQQPFHCPPGGG